MSKLIRRAEAPLNMILDAIGPGNKIKFVANDRQYLVNVCSERLLLFKRSLVCVSCGAQGSKFFLELPFDNKVKKPHFNLYAYSGVGEVLMTKDHIIPKSKGGPTHPSNLQTMCAPCNVKKGTKS